MADDQLSLDAARQVTSRSLTGYARGLGWQPVANGSRREIAVFHWPDSRLHQVIIPTDPTLADFAEAVLEAVKKLAAFEKRPAHEVLEHLLLPPADLLQFREISTDADVGSLPFDRAVRLINGLRRLLLSAAHSVLVPQPYHPRLSRTEAEEFLGRCRLGQTERGSFVVNVACPLELQLALTGMAAEPFTRQVTSLVMNVLDALARAAEATRTDELIEPTRAPGLSANQCESLLLLRPTGDRASVLVTAIWSRALLPSSRESSRMVQLDQDVFGLAEALAPRLRSTPQPRPSRFIGFVDALRGQPSPDDPRPAGEVDFTLFDDEQGEIHARGNLKTDEYAKALEAHAVSDPVSFQAILRRLPRVSRVDSINDFERLRFEDQQPGVSSPSTEPTEIPS
jgi:hypothetical protein